MLRRSTRKVRAFETRGDVANEGDAEEKLVGRRTEKLNKSEKRIGRTNVFHVEKDTTLSKNKMFDDER